MISTGEIAMVCVWIFASVCALSKSVSGGGLMAAVIVAGIVTAVVLGH